MKSYFSWKGLSSNRGQSNTQETSAAKPVLRGAALQSVITDGIASVGPHALSVVRAEEPQDRKSTAMELMVRTIGVLNRDMELLNAVLLCSFAVPDAGLNFIAYSLNEGVGDADVRVYIANLYCAEGLFSIGSSAPDHGWQSAFWQIVREATGSADSSAEQASLSAYHLIDVAPQILPTALLEQHATLDINRAFVTRLISWQGTAAGPAIECCPSGAVQAKPEMTVLRDPHLMCVDSELLELSANVMLAEVMLDSTRLEEIIEVSLATAPTCATPVHEDPVGANPQAAFDDFDESSDLLDEVENTLSSIAEMAQGLERSSQASISQRQRQDILQNQLLEKERQLNEQEQLLTRDRTALREEHQRTEALSERLRAHQAVLDELEARLQNRGEELARGLHQLSLSRAKFTGIVKKFQASVQQKNAQLRHLSEPSELLG